MSSTNLLDAVRIVKENERLAVESYSEAAKKINNRMGRELFEQLSEFEKHHYAHLTALENSLLEKGDYIDYKGREFPLPPIFEINAEKETGQKSVMQIIASAIELEQKAEKTYSDLAGQISDPRGHAMFRRFADEEHMHFRILEEAYWTLTNLGVWKWSI